MGRAAKRLDKIEEKVEGIPITSDALDQAFAQFISTGELPEHERLAHHVLDRTLRASRHRSLREILLHEAVHQMQEIRMAARLVLQLLVGAGRDVLSRDLLDEGMELPAFGSVGLSLLGWPEILIQPPYTRQAKRVIAQLEEIREGVDDPDEEWFERFAALAVRFFKVGELPEDQFLRDAVLAYSEVLSLGRVLGGQEDVEVLEVFDEAAKSKGKAREESLDRLRELAMDGRIP